MFNENRFDAICKASRIWSYLEQHKNVAAAKLTESVQKFYLISQCSKVYRNDVRSNKGDWPNRTQSLSRIILCSRKFWKRFMYALFEIRAQISTTRFPSCPLCLSLPVWHHNFEQRRKKCRNMVWNITLILSGKKWRRALTYLSNRTSLFLIKARKTGEIWKSY